MAWLERRLQGILIYKQHALGPLLPGHIFPPSVETRYKVIGYIDDIKPAITTMNEFLMVDIKYVALSDHLDMVGVQLKATYAQTKKINGDALQDRVSKVVGPWKGGKFMCLTLRPLSLNCYCSSKLWFKCGSIDLRVADIKKITSNMRSWLFADQLEHPEELVLYRPRKAGGLGLYSIKYRAMA